VAIDRDATAEAEVHKCRGPLGAAGARTGKTGVRATCAAASAKSLCRRFRFVCVLVNFSASAWSGTLNRAASAGDTGDDAPPGALTPGCTGVTGRRVTFARGSKISCAICCTRSSRSAACARPVWRCSRSRSASLLSAATARSESPAAVPGEDATRIPVCCAQLSSSVRMRSSIGISTSLPDLRACGCDSGEETESRGAGG
jgi:hypothetical protein